MSYRIISVLVLTTIINLIKLKGVPAGLTQNEVKLGLEIANVLPAIGYDIFYIRIIAAALSIAGLFSIYFVASKIFGKKVALVFMAISGLSPWFIVGTRDINGFLLSGMVLFAVSVLLYLSTKRWSVFFALIFLLASVVTAVISKPTIETLSSIDRQRNSIPNAPMSLRRVFINRYTESFNYHTKKVFNAIDPGVYFFDGHPRERWGIEESPKLYFTLIPLFVLGLWTIKKSYILPIVYLSIISLGMVIFNSQIPEILFSMIATLVVSMGILNLRKQHHIVPILFFLMTIIEAANFFGRYYSQAALSRFSERRLIYRDVSQVMINELHEGETVYVDHRIGDLSDYLKYYSKGSIKNPVVVLDIDARKQKPNGLIIDTLPYDPSPSEPLYTPTGTSPDFIKEISRFDDGNRNMTLFLYR